MSLPEWCVNVCVCLSVSTTTFLCCSSRWFAGIIVLTANATRTARPILIQVEGIRQEQLAGSLDLVSCWLFFIQKLYIAVWKYRD